LLNLYIYIKIYIGKISYLNFIGLSEICVSVDLNSLRILGLSYKTDDASYQVTWQIVQMRYTCIGLDWIQGLAPRHQTSLFFVHPAASSFSPFAPSLSLLDLRVWSLFSAISPYQCRCRFDKGGCLVLNIPRRSIPDPCASSSEIEVCAVLRTAIPLRALESATIWILQTL
jgi:hypothetical protein